MEKIIIFTNFTSLGNVSLTNRNNITFYNGDNIISYDIKQNFENLRFFKYDNNSIFRSAFNIQNGEIFFIYDEITTQEFNNFLDGYEIQKIGILFHLNDGLFNINVENSISKQGQHMPHGECYPLMLRILTDGNGNEFNRLKVEVFNYVPKLEAVLEFLHNSLGEEGINFSKLSGVFSLAEIKKIETLSKDFKKKKIETLISIRDELLKMVDV